MDCNFSNSSLQKLSKTILVNITYRTVIHSVAWSIYRKGFSNFIKITSFEVRPRKENILTPGFTIPCA
jgi:hypothetical protein